MTIETFVDGVDFGEGPRWHDGALWYSDFFHHAVYRVSPGGVRERVLTLETQPSGLGWLPNGDLLVVSMLDRSLKRWDGTTLTDYADLSGIATFHCNDMVVSATGHAYVGNFGWNIYAGRTPIVPATLAHVTPDRTVHAAADGLLFPNGSVITPDGSTLIIGESSGSRYTAFRIAADGSLHDRRVWADTPGSRPDGCTLDAEGGIWFADAGGARVQRVLEGGRITHTVDMGMNTFACALGGAHGRTLYVLLAPSSAEAEVAGKGLGRIVAFDVEAPHAGLP
ncbi:MAG: SMP-30/gluconolactonase/LRE family protein [Acidimicrobiia bacterium]